MNERQTYGRTRGRSRRTTNERHCMMREHKTKGRKEERERESEESRAVHFSSVALQAYSIAVGRTDDGLGASLPPRRSKQQDGIVVVGRAPWQFPCERQPKVGREREREMDGWMPALPA